MIKYLTLSQIKFIHERSIKHYGGTLGIRDSNLLESAIARPKISVFGEDAYPDLFLKTAVIFYSIINNHPFLDGNKRTAFGAMHMMLLLNNYDLKCSFRIAEEMVLNVAIGKIDENDISKWIEKYSKKI